MNIYGRPVEKLCRIVATTGTIMAVIGILQDGPLLFSGWACWLC